MAWVAPQEGTRNGKMLLAVREAKEDGVWNLAALFALAEEWRVSYVIVQGPNEPATEALFAAGRYSVIDVEEGYNDRPTGKGEEDRSGRLTKPTANSLPPTAYFPGHGHGNGHGQGSMSGTRMYTDWTDVHG